MAHAIADDVAEVLRAAKCQSDRLTLVGELERKLYERVNKILEISGFKWNRKEKCHVAIKGTAAETLAQALDDGKIVDPKKEWDFFETPLDIAARMAWILNIRDEDEILEPSVGGGRLYEALLRFGANPNRVWVCEAQPELAEKWKKMGEWKTYNNGDRAKISGPWFLANDFMITDKLDIDCFDKIIANFPFSNFQDITHCRHAYDMLRKGGRMVCITGPSWQSRTDKKSTAFRDWFNGLSSTSISELPAGTFKDSGTNVRSLLLVIDKK